MSNLTYLNDASVLHNLKQRYYAQLIYVSCTGRGVVVCQPEVGRRSTQSVQLCSLTIYVFAFCLTQFRYWETGRHPVQYMEVVAAITRRSCIYIYVKRPILMTYMVKLISQFFE